MVEPPADDGLARYVKERLGEGYDEREVRQALIQNGHGAAAVDAAFARLRRRRGPGLLPLFLLLLIGVAVVLFFALRQQAPTQPPAPQTNTSNKQPPATGIPALAAQLIAAAANQTADQAYYASVQAATTNAATVPDGILLCSVNKEISYKNYCLQRLAEQRKEAGYCEVIGDAKQRDDCYIGLILKGEDQYCAKLILDDSKRVCTLLGA